VSFLQREGQPVAQQPEEGHKMNFHFNSSTSAAPQQLPSTRKALRSHLRGQPPKIRAKVAAKILQGEWPYEPSVAEIAAAVRTHPRCVHAALGRDRKTLTDAEVDRVVERIGADRVWRALDRYTSPSFNF
jgi:hypothetical protein